MDKAYLRWFLDAFSFPFTAQEYLLTAQQSLTQDKRANTCFLRLVQSYKKDKFTPWDALLGEVELLAKTVDLHADTVVLLFLIALTEPLKGYYLQENIAEWIWKDTVSDLRYKAVENHLLYGVWGVVDRAWFSGFFQMRKFGFGLLQFEVVKYKGKDNYEKDGVLLTKDSDVINVHIPRTGEKLERAKAQSSYREASQFFASKFADKPVVFVCKSWLLFPKNKEFVKPTSNLALFISDFTIVEVGYYDDYSWRWRVFDTKEENIEKLPQNTSLQRRYIELMKRGEPTGFAYGVFVYNLS